jgi:inorganic triphosphatase YgiF
MTAFMPVTLRFCDNTTMLVGSVADAARALAQQWPDKTAPSYVEAARLVTHAMDGTCSQRIAFDALTSAARRQNLLVVRPKSRAHDWLDAVADF